jgi:hypothetical protein
MGEKLKKLKEKMSILNNKYPEKVIIVKRNPNYTPKPEQVLSDVAISKIKVFFDIKD